MVAYRRFQDSIIRMFSRQPSNPSTNASNIGTTAMASPSSYASSSPSSAATSSGTTSSRESHSPQVNKKKNYNSTFIKNCGDMNGKPLHTGNLQRPQPVTMQRKNYNAIPSYRRNNNNFSDDGGKNDDYIVSHGKSPLISSTNRSRNHYCNNGSRITKRMSPVSIIRSPFNSSYNANNSKIGVKQNMLMMKNNLVVNDDDNNKFIRNNSIILKKYHQIQLNQDKKTSMKSLHNNNNFKDSWTGCGKEVKSNKTHNFKTSSTVTSQHLQQTNDRKFSRYTPLPAINCNDNNNIKSRRKLIRQLTYKVIDPVFVKGPISMMAADNKKQVNTAASKSTIAKHQVNNNNDFKTSSSPSSSTQFNKRSKTIIINKNNSFDNLQSYSNNGEKKHYRTNKSSSSVNYNTSCRNKTHKIEKFSKNVHGKRLHVKKNLIEAAEKVKEGQPLIDNAFWVDF